MSIPDNELADEVIARLNKLAEDPAVRSAIADLIERRVPVPEEVANHPTIQVADSRRVGFLGVLNGLIGATGPHSKKPGWGYVAAVYDDNGLLTGFARTES